MCKKVKSCHHVLTEADMETIASEMIGNRNGLIAKAACLTHGQRAMIIAKYWMKRKAA
jgi:hypothetical protein